MKLFRSLLFSLTVLAAALCPGLPVAAQTPGSMYLAGASYNNGASSPVAGTLLYAKAVSPDTTNGMFAFTAVDVVPNTLKPFTVTTNIGAGIAEKIATIANVPVYIPTSAGISFNGQSTGWAFTGGVATPIRFKNHPNWYAMPNLRFLKSSVSNGSGYQLIPGVLFGWGQ